MFMIVDLGCSRLSSQKCLLQRVNADSSFLKMHDLLAAARAQALNETLYQLLLEGFEYMVKERAERI